MHHDLLRSRRMQNCRVVNASCRTMPINTAVRLGTEFAVETSRVHSTHVDALSIEKIVINETDHELLADEFLPILLHFELEVLRRVRTPPGIVAHRHITDCLMGDDERLRSTLFLRVSMTTMLELRARLVPGVSMLTLLMLLTWVRVLSVRRHDDDRSDPQ